MGRDLLIGATFVTGMLYLWLADSTTDDGKFAVLAGVLLVALALFARE